MAKFSRKYDVEIWAYCLMPNHVHLIMQPSDLKGLSKTIARAHQKYARIINLQHDWTGHLWDSRFYSCPMDEGHFISALKYVELNPVRAKLVNNAVEWPWSSARAHLAGQDDLLVKVRPGLQQIRDWHSFLEMREENNDWNLIRKHTRTGKPLSTSERGDSHRF